MYGQHLQSYGRNLDLGTTNTPLFSVWQELVWVVIFIVDVVLHAIGRLAPDWLVDGVLVVKEHQSW
ncbi:hypothetical protein C0J52_02139 [Blattella germanica]|nr:hypothetical protein C0J52_02139 [Blattella germanica]